MNTLLRQGARTARCTRLSQAVQRPLAKSFASPNPLRTLSSTAKNPDALLSEQDPIKAEKEQEAVTRLERLLKVSERLAKDAGKSSVPLSMKGLGVYSKDGVVQREEENLEGLEPLPKERKMGDSFCLMDLRFSEDDALREEFVGSYSKVRMGALLEKFDWLAGSSAVSFS